MEGPAGADAVDDVVGAVEGGGADSSWELVFIPGVGLPSRWPPPEKGTYFFFGCTYFSLCWSSFTSTSCPASTFKMLMGARPCFI